MDLYKRLDKDLRPLPKKPDGSIDLYGVGLENNDIEALRHAYISGVYTIEYNERTAELMGRLNELSSFDSRSMSVLSENMDFWNNSVGRFYGNKANELTVRKMRS